MIEKKKKWKLTDFDYPLPEKYIAQYPAKRRDLSKLMVLHRETGKIEHKTFSKLPAKIVQRQKWKFFYCVN